MMFSLASSSDAILSDAIYKLSSLAELLDLLGQENPFIRNLFEAIHNSETNMFF